MTRFRGRGARWIETIPRTTGFHLQLLHHSRLATHVTITVISNHVVHRALILTNHTNHIGHILLSQLFRVVAINDVTQLDCKLNRRIAIPMLNTSLKLGSRISIQAKRERATSDSETFRITIAHSKAIHATQIGMLQ